MNIQKSSQKPLKLMILLPLSRKKNQNRATRRTRRIRFKTRTRLRIQTLQWSLVKRALDRIGDDVSQTSKKTPNNSKERRSTRRRVIEMVLMALMVRLLLRLRARDQLLLATEISAEIQLPRMEMKLKSTRVEKERELEVLAEDPRTKTVTIRNKMVMVETTATIATIRTESPRRRSLQTSRKKIRPSKRRKRKCLTSMSHLWLNVLLIQDLPSISLLNGAIEETNFS